jgi:hypothetical protein
MHTTDVRINIQETFPHLNQAPIVEAAIDLRARAEASWEETAVSAALK